MIVKLDPESRYRDRIGRKWVWCDANGWVVNGLATFGGFWPHESFAPYTVIDPCVACGR